MKRISTLKELAELVGTTPWTYRRNYWSRPDHPKPIFTDKLPARFRTAEVMQWLGLDKTDFQ